ncbi:MAG: tetratricopeptide repeat protein [Desulfobacterales bacterium]|nr:tetratricopeptide repeat protein [Desulfobacterales bacterium]
MKIFLSIVGVIFFLTLSSIPSGGNCQKAVELYNTATESRILSQKERLFKESISCNCEDPKIVAKIYNNLADTYENQNRLDKAISYYLKASETNPLLPTPYESLGDVYKKLNNDEQATRYYNKAFIAKKFKSEEDIVKELSPTRAIYVKKPLSVSTPQDKIRPPTPSTSTPKPPSETLYFAFDSNKLDSYSVIQLEELLNAINKPDLVKYRFRLAGHTCNLGTDDYNQGLSERRAKAVKDWLVNPTVKDRFVSPLPDNQLEIIGYGKRKPIADNRIEENRWLNRRVEIRPVGTMVSYKRGETGNITGLKLKTQGENLLVQERYKDALYHFENALKSFRKTDDRTGMQAVLRNIFITYQFLGDFDKARHYMEQADKLDPR